MARVVFVCVVMLSVLAGCFAKELSLLDLLRTLSDDREDNLAEKAFDISGLETVATESIGDLNSVLTTLLRVLKFSSPGEATLSHICKELVGHYEDHHSNLRKAFKRFDDAFKAVRAKLGQTRSFDMRNELRADLDLMDALDSSLDRRTSVELSEDDVKKLREKVKDALNDIGTSGDEAIRSTKDNTNLNQIKTELLKVFTPASNLGFMIGVLKAKCLRAGLNTEPN